MVASEEGERRDRYRAQQLSHPAIRRPKHVGFESRQSVLRIPTFRTLRRNDTPCTTSPSVAGLPLRFLSMAFFASDTPRPTALSRGRTPSSVLAALLNSALFSSPLAAALNSLDGFHFTGLVGNISAAGGPRLIYNPPTLTYTQVAAVAPFVFDSARLTGVRGQSAACTSATRAICKIFFG